MSTTGNSKNQERIGTVLVVGAAGFLGGFIVTALRDSGWNVLRGIRPEGRRLADDERTCDLVELTSPEAWYPMLEGVDAVVNVAGILREESGQTFDVIHYQSPLALATACVERGVKRFVQISALGVPADGGFIASKHRFDSALLELPLQSIVLRPSVVYATAGSYGGTSLLRALAAFPGFQLLPSHGLWPIQPVAAEDLARLVARAVVSGQSGTYDVGAPEPISLRNYQAAWRRWMRIAGKQAVSVPEALVTAQAWIWERLGRGPVGETMWRMLRRGNTTRPDAAARLEAEFGITPRALDDVLALRPSQVQDRRHAQLYFLAPTLRMAVVVLWVLSAFAGFFTPAVKIEQLASGSILASMSPVALVRAASVIDFMLAGWLLSGWRPRMAIAFMAMSLLAYTVIFGLVLPVLWLEPLGGLAKNLVLLPALAVLWVLVDRR